MSLSYKRVVRVEIDGASERVEIGDVRVRFTVRKSRSENPNDSEIAIYNLAPSTAAAARETGAVVRLFAGYEGAEILVTQSEIVKVRTEYEPPDIITVVELLDGVVALRNTRLSLSFVNGATVRQVIDAIAREMGLAVRPININLGVPLRGGYSRAGRAGPALTEVTSRVGATWSVQNGDLLILGPDGIAPREAALISPQTGLVRVPEPMETETDSERQAKKKRAGFRVSTLLRGEIEPGDPVVIESRDVDGRFVVDEIEHRGDNRGQEFYSDLILLEP